LSAEENSFIVGAALGKDIKRVYLNNNKQFYSSEKPGSKGFDG